MYLGLGLEYPHTHTGILITCAFTYFRQSVSLKDYVFGG